MKLKRLITVLLGVVIALAVPLFAACNGGGTGDEVRLLVWAAPEQYEYTLDIIAEYKRQHPETNYNITLRIVAEPEVRNTIIDVNTAADVFAFPSDQLADFYRRGFLFPITGQRAADTIAAHTPSSIRAATVNDRLWAFPVSESNTYFLVYDTRVLDRETVMTTATLDGEEMEVMTIDGILDALAAAPTVGGEPRQIFLDIGNSYYTVVYFFGADVYFRQEIGEPGAPAPATTNVDTEAGQNAVRAMMDLMDRGGDRVFLEGEMDALVRLASGHIAAYITGTWRLPQLREAFGDYMGIAPMPWDYIGGELRPLRPFMGAKYYAVNRFSRNPGHAMRFASFITNAENQLIRFDHINEIPSNLEALNNPRVVADPVAQVVEIQRSFAVGQYDLPDIWSVLGAFGGDVREGLVNRTNYVARLDSLANHIRTPIV